MGRRVLLIAGEASGDLHGGGVVRALRALAPDVETYGIGGENMRQAGMELLFHVRDLAFMGFVEVVRNLPTIFRVENRLDEVLRSRRPDVVVLIDYPGFNLRFARRAKHHGIPVVYYISPQVWAWRRGRVHTMRRLVDRMKVVFPFEVEMYREAGVPVEFVGHPLAEHLGGATDRAGFFARHGLDPARTVLALFPGSRRQEIERILPVMANAAALLARETGCQVVVGVAPALGPGILREHLTDTPGVTLIENATHGLMEHADAAIVTSGTATLETGWFGTPMVVVYRTSPITFFIGRLLVRVPYIGLVNIVAGERVVPELIQRDLTPARLAAAVRPLLVDPGTARAMRGKLAVIRERLGAPGASERVARDILALAEGA
jgi:lipid-A-disaccharide synthase